VQSGISERKVYQDLIKTYNAPVPNFLMRPGDIVYVPDNELMCVNFTDVDSDKNDIIEWSWDFGDGLGSSSQFDAEYMYHVVREDEPHGKYAVSLTATYN